MSIFSKNLRFLRKKGNHNQDDLAILFNKRANTIGNWENQKSEPSLTELMKLGVFFKVSTEDLLHSDLEMQVRLQGDAYIAGDFAQTVKSYALPEHPGSMAREAGPDAFWLILRELRAVHEKVDLLLAARESADPKRNSDKSYH
jgi:transcriptional regulator with XRE-family HTH domain